MAAGYCLPRCLHVIANLGVADALEETPQTAAELAAAVGANWPGGPGDYGPDNYSPFAEEFRHA